MNVDARLETIRGILEQDGTVKLCDLAARFPQVHPMTLRRDLARLEKEGVAVKVRGGARAIATEPDLREPVYSLRAASDVAPKMRIARRALPFLETGRSVYFDSGTTMMCLASVLPDVRLMAVTSGPNIALELLRHRRATVNLVGGLVHPDNLAISGKQALDFIRTVNIDLAFLATSGLTVRDGFTCGNYNEAELKRAVIKKASRVILLMDSGKADRALTFTFATPRDIDVLITDQPLPKPLQRMVARSGVETVVADDQPAI